MFATLSVSSVAAPQAAPILSIVTPAQSVSLGATLTVDFLVDGVIDLFAYQFSIDFDPLLLSANGVSEGAFLSTAGSTFFIPGTIDSIAGVIAFNAGSLVGGIAGATGNGSLLSVQFTALGPGVTQILPFFDLPNGDGLFDSLFNPMESTTLGGAVTIDDVTPVPEPATLLLFGAGLGALYSKARRRERQKIS